jgi:hypothetical protein
VATCGHCGFRWGAVFCVCAWPSCRRVIHSGAYRSRRAHDRAPGAAHRRAEAPLWITPPLPWRVVVGLREMQRWMVDFGGDREPVAIAEICCPASKGRHLRGCLAPPSIRVGVRNHHRAPDSLFAMRRTEVGQTLHLRTGSQLRGPSERRAVCPPQLSPRCSLPHPLVERLLLRLVSVLQGGSGSLQHVGFLRTNDHPRHLVSRGITPQSNHQFSRYADDADETLAASCLGKAAVEPQSLFTVGLPT